ncbi:MAG TPA: hypothetical protein HPP64_10575 [Gammaproteobacteria bacterium]|nr:hypothetical protein [Gammaproteobacteria bacterium]
MKKLASNSRESARFNQQVSDSGHTHYEADGDEVIRIISARKATSFERRNYEDQR